MPVLCWCGLMEHSLARFFTAKGTFFTFCPFYLPKAAKMRQEHRFDTWSSQRDEDIYPKIKDCSDIVWPVIILWVSGKCSLFSGNTFFSYNAPNIEGKSFHSTKKTAPKPAAEHHFWNILDQTFLAWGSNVCSPSSTLLGKINKLSMLPIIHFFL